ncbi:MAG: lipoyl(octanoyl) transferase [Planctomycetes bacterium]|nr:lipoyl(octanoyl) transferase [Planctomycetota bacterium]
MHVGQSNWGTVESRSPALEVYLLGLVDFDSALFLQERFVQEISSRRDRQGVLLLCEHPPMVTVGRSGRSAELAVGWDQLAHQGIPVRWISRGGGCLVHLPGQLAVYCLLPLDRLGVGLSEFRRRLQAAAVCAAGEVKVPALPCENPPGACSRSGQFAFVGAAVRGWVSLHGFFLNVNLDMYRFRRFYRREMARRMTSLEVERQRATPMHAVRESVIRHLAQLFGYERSHIYSGHPLLRRTRRRIHAYA